MQSPLRWLQPQQIWAVTCQNRNHQGMQSSLHIRYYLQQWSFWTPFLPDLRMVGYLNISGKTEKVLVKFPTQLFYTKISSFIAHTPPTRVHTGPGMWREKLQAWNGGRDGSVVRAGLVIERLRVWIPAGAAGESSSPGSTFCADSYFSIRSTPPCYCSSTQKTPVILPRPQVTAKHAYTLRMWLCMKWHGAWLYGVHRTRQDGGSFLWHQPCQCCKYTTLVDIKKTRYKKLFTHVESHVSAVSLLESGE